MVGSIFDSGGRTFKFERDGDSINGELVEFREEQQTKYDSKNQKPTDIPAVYDNGDPVMQLILTLSTDILDDEEDDGRRYVYVASGRAKKAVVNAVRAAGSKVPEPGGRFTITYTGKDPASFNGSAKMFTAEYRKPDARSAVFGTGGVQQPGTVASASLGTQQQDPWTPTDQVSGLSAATVEKVRNLKSMGLAVDVIVGALASEGVTAADVQAA